MGRFTEPQISCGTGGPEGDVQFEEYSVKIKKRSTNGYSEGMHKRAS
jgi:hypothetical protein